MIARASSPAPKSTNRKICWPTLICCRRPSSKGGCRWNSMWKIGRAHVSTPRPSSVLDDCTRVFPGSKIYQSENLLAYFDLLPAAFIEGGLPLELYVDYHSLFFTHTPQALTQLGRALHFYGITFRYAPTPQAKGKIERSHFFWQERLPAYFASENITDLHQANPHIQALRLHRNQHEIHRELKMKPQQAWNLALKEKRSVLRPVPNCPWWPFVWSLRTN